jgi:predicted nucleic acid-binding Zn ribbon protein
MPEEPEPDLLDSLIERAQEGTAEHLERRMRESDSIKRQEEQASQRRLEHMWAVEHERQRSLEDARDEQKRQEQMLMRFALVGAAIVILVIIVLTLILGLASG